MEQTAKPRVAVFTFFVPDDGRRRPQGRDLDCLMLG